MIKRIDEPNINKRIVLLFLEKLEILKQEERKEILVTIKLLNNPTYVCEIEGKYDLSKSMVDKSLKTV